MSVKENLVVEQIHVTPNNFVTEGTPLYDYRELSAEDMTIENFWDIIQDKERRRAVGTLKQEVASMDLTVLQYAQDALDGSLMVKGAEVCFSPRAPLSMKSLFTLPSSSKIYMRWIFPKRFMLRETVKRR